MSETPSRTTADLRREITRILGGKGMSNDFGHGADYRAFTPAGLDSRLRPAGRTTSPATRGPFGRWLLVQVERRGLVGDLATGAMADRGFPGDGDSQAAEHVPGRWQHVRGSRRGGTRLGKLLGVIASHMAN